jgi:hypothetical protein
MNEDGKLKADDLNKEINNNGKDILKTESLINIQENVGKVIETMLNIDINETNSCSYISNSSYSSSDHEAKHNPYYEYLWGCSRKIMYANNHANLIKAEPDNYPIEKFL